LEGLQSAAFATAWFSWVAVLIALIPVMFVAAASRESGSRWRIPGKDGKSDRKVHYVLLGLIGGLAGEFTAVISLFISTWWACRTGNQVCHDGQAGMVLIVTIPVLSFLGSILSLVWTWISLGFASNRLWASLFRYDGPNRLLNRVLATAIQIIFWPLFTLVIVRLIS
jgi:hypothetical protein